MHLGGRIQVGLEARAYSWQSLCISVPVCYLLWTLCLLELVPLDHIGGGIRNLSAQESKAERRTTNSRPTWAAQRDYDLKAKIKPD